MLPFIFSIGLFLGAQMPIDALCPTVSATYRRKKAAPKKAKKPPFYLFLSYKRGKNGKLTAK